MKKPKWLEGPMRFNDSQRIFKDEDGCKAQLGKLAG
jgi:hypothetical protein